ncbi:hypothetical protein PINS_up010918 [Pythium insidiosum]|nr:hypothetical protein PINS_up010918 [Pythium insidiosum]
MRRLCHAAYASWMAAQVELHGQYSAERVVAFDAYGSYATRWRLCALLIVSPLPCLMFVIVYDWFPLRPPSEGLEASRNFWIRTLLGTLVLSYSIVLQFRHNIRGLPLTHWHVIMISVVSSVGLCAILIGIASRLGFPLPFMVILGATPWSLLASATGYVFLRTHLQNDPELVNSVRRYSAVFYAQTFLTVAYPAYTYVFQRLESQSQAAFACFLPILKLASKNLFSYASRHIEDLKPELVVFNVEVFSALYVSSCLQKTTSIYSTIVIMSADAIHAWLSIKDVHDLLNDPKLVLARRTTGDMPLLPLTMHLIQSDPMIRQHPSIQLESCMAPTATTAVVARATQQHDNLLHHHRPLGGPRLHQVMPLPLESSKFLFVAPANSPAIFLPHQSRNPQAVTNNQRRLALATTTKLKRAFWRPSGQVATTELHACCQQLTSDEKLFIVQHTLRVLHASEFIGLVEYVEVVVPFVYSLFALLTFHFPNRAFYSMYNGMDSHKLHNTLWNLVIYGFLELLSLIILDAVLRRQLRISAFTQTAFVLETQWPMVQSKLALWVTVALQYAIVHYGADFSFRFEWLQQPQ